MHSHRLRRVLPAAISVALAGCSTLSEPLPPTPNAPITVESSTSSARRSSTSTTLIAATTTPSALTTRTTDEGRAGETVQSAATAAIEEILSPNETASGSDLWRQALSGDRIIQTTVLHEAADRAEVAVSLAFNPAPDGTIIEPIAVRVELTRTAETWTVTGIGYL